MIFLKLGEVLLGRFRNAPEVHVVSKIRFFHGFGQGIGGEAFHVFLIRRRQRTEIVKSSNDKILIGPVI